jgi:hypothetical protein
MTLNKHSPSGVKVFKTNKLPISVHPVMPLKEKE